jgi:TrmH family RNA methyltransferase
VPSEPLVSSRQNPRFKEALALRDGRQRRQREQMLVDGGREISRAIDAGLRVVEAWVSPETIRSQAAHTALVTVNASGADIIETSAELLARLSYGERDEGIVAIVAQPSTELAGLDLPAEPLIAVLERVEKPGNLGAVLRSADGAGVNAVIVADPVSDPWNPNAIRASLGTIFSTPLAVAAAPDTLEFLRERGLDIVAARVDAELDYDQADMRGAVAVVLGSENAGLSETWAGDGITSVRIPMLGRADSLNISASAAILLYEARRQRRAP